MLSMEVLEEIALAKSGAMVAFPAAFGAIAGGADPETVAAYRAYGVALGVLLQFSNDANDIFRKPWSHDLARGAKNMVVVAAGQQLSGAARTDFMALLDAARTSPEAQAEVRRMLRRKELVWPWLEVGVRHAEGAYAALERAQPAPPMADLLRRLVTDIAPTVEPGERLMWRFLCSRSA
jgi:geranylgeranyl pyrophosphate synthase